MSHLFNGLLIVIALWPNLLAADTEVFAAVDYGVQADGVHDDGPAIQRVLEAARKAEGKVRIDFPDASVIRVASGTNRYAFWLTDDAEMEINGNGAEFRLEPHLRFMNAFNCERLTVRNLKVDYTLQPSTPGTILSVDAERKCIEVVLDDAAYASHLNGPTTEDGEQAFFGMIELDALNGTKRVEHYYVDRVENPGGSVVFVYNSRTNFEALKERVVAGQTRVGLPVSGVAHRFGPGALFEISNNDNVLFEDIEVWSAPWFSIRIFRNEGIGIFRNVNVRPKPDSGKVLSSCRDAFHVKGNRAQLLFENCELTGLGDDAFNIATHASRVVKVESGSKLRIRQNFPIQYIPIRVGDHLVFLDGEANRLVGERKIKSVNEIHSKQTASQSTRFVGNAPAVEVELEEPLSELQKDLIVWARESSSPNTTIRNCHMERSCRLMTSVTIEDCTIDAFVWFYGDHKEGPVPESIIVQNSRLRSNSITRGGNTAFSISGWNERKGASTWEALPGNFPTRRVQFTGNQIYGKAFIRDALSVTLDHNEFFYEGANPLKIENCLKVEKTGNQFREINQQIIK